MGVLAVEGEGSRAEFGGLEAKLSCKARREFVSFKGKARLVMSWCDDVNVH